MRKVFLMILGALLSAQVASAQVTEADLMGAGMPGLQAETVYDLATQGTVEGNSIAFQRDSALQSFLLSPNSSDGADDSRICLSGGGACDGAGSRGGFARIGGNEYTSGGDFEIYSGDSAGSNVTIGTIASGGTISFLADAARSFLTLSSSSATSLTNSFGAAATATQTFSFVSASSDGADNDYLCLSGGGSCVAPTRGSYLSLYGNETAEAGDVSLVTGSASGSTMFLTAGATNGTIVMSTNGTTALTIESDQDAVYAGEITSSETGSLGWSLVSAANQACTTTCTSAAVFGWDTGTSLPVGPATATADHCICAGAS